MSRYCAPLQAPLVHVLELRPLLVLADQAGIDGSLVRQVMRDSAIDLSEPKKVEILANRPRCPNRGSSARYSVRSASTGSTAVARRAGK